MPYPVVVITWKFHLGFRETPELGRFTVVTSAAIGWVCGGLHKKKNKDRKLLIPPTHSRNNTP